MHFSRPQKCVLDNLSEKNSLQSCVQVGFWVGWGGWGGAGGWGGGLITSRSDAGSTTGKEAASSNAFLGHH